MHRLLPIALLFAAVTLARAGADKAPVYNNVSSAKLETILAGMGVKLTKLDAKKDGVDFYDLKLGDRVLRLHNYGGQDLWLDCVFSEKLSLADVNSWNTRAKYSRAVLIKQDKGTTISLEAQIDCLGGVTDAIVRQFIRRFEGDVKAFEKFLSK